MTTYADIHREMRRGARPELVHAWAVGALTEIADGRRPLRAVRHPLGFICLPVERAGRDGVCVHVWPAGRAAADPVTSSMHSHSWDLLSHVLYGQVRNEIIEVSDAASDPRYRVFEVRSRGDVDELLPTARLVRARTGRAHTHAAGESYALRAGEFHTTEVPPGQEAATVALGRTAPGACDLSLGALDGRTHRMRRDRCDPAETVRTVRAVARRLAAAAAGAGGDDDT